MTDIVERLRGGPGYTGPVDPLDQEAADEIERLRIALRDLVDAADGNISDNEGALFRAHKALPQP